jgi:hypothetical protein
VKEAWDMFSILMERYSGVHMELGDDYDYAVKREEIVLFQLDLGGSFDSQDVLYVLVLKKNFLLVSAMEDMGFFVTFYRRKALIHPKKTSLDITVVIGVREGNLYKLQGT